MKKSLIPVFLAALMLGQAVGAEPSSVDVLRAKFPKGIPWSVEVSDTTGKSLGSLEMRITSVPASSCLGDIASDGVKVEFIRNGSDSLKLPIASYGIAKFTNNNVKIDLTGGMCDAYLIMDGTIKADGSSAGQIYKFGMRGGNDVGTYRATVGE
jgi:hypothetical protein